MVRNRLETLPPCTFALVLDFPHCPSPDNTWCQCKVYPDSITDMPVTQYFFIRHGRPRFMDDFCDMCSDHNRNIPIRWNHPFFRSVGLVLFALYPFILPEIVSHGSIFPCECEFITIVQYWPRVRSDPFLPHLPSIRLPWFLAVNDELTTQWSCSRVRNSDSPLLM